VLIIPGHLFFPGQESVDWAHKHECIRMSYGSLTNDETLREGIRAIATEAAGAYKDAATFQANTFVPKES
jgi:valine--pyruvate aminotransferase